MPRSVTSMAMIKYFCYLANVDFRYMQCFHPRYLAARFNNPRYLSEYRQVNGIMSLRISGYRNIIDLRAPTESCLTGHYQKNKNVRF